MATCSLRSTGRWRGFWEASTLDEGLGYFALDRRFGGSTRDILVGIFCVVVAREALCHGVDGGPRGARG